MPDPNPWLQPPPSSWPPGSGVKISRWRLEVDGRAAHLQEGVGEERRGLRRPPYAHPLRPCVQAQPQEGPLKLMPGVGWRQMGRQRLPAKE
jgi:hypothetical protein